MKDWLGTKFPALTITKAGGKDRGVSSSSPSSSSFSSSRRSIMILLIFSLCSIYELNHIILETGFTIVIMNHASNGSGSSSSSSSNTRSTSIWDGSVTTKKYGSSNKNDNDDSVQLVSSEDQQREKYFLLSSIDFDKEAVCGHFNCLFRSHFTPSEIIASSVTTTTTTTTTKSTTNFTSNTVLITNAQDTHLEFNIFDVNLVKMMLDEGAGSRSTTSSTPSSIGYLCTKNRRNNPKQSNYYTYYAGWEWTKHMEETYNIRHVYLGPPKSIPKLSSKESKRFNEHLQKNVLSIMEEERNVANNSSSNNTSTKSSTPSSTRGKKKEEGKKKRHHSFTSRHSIAMQPVRIIENGLVVGCSDGKQKLWNTFLRQVQYPNVTINDLQIIINILNGNNNGNDDDADDDDDDDDCDDNDDDDDTTTNPDVWNLLRDFQVLVDPTTGHVYHLDMDRPFEPVETFTSSLSSLPSLNGTKNDDNNVVDENHEEEDTTSTGSSSSSGATDLVDDIDYNKNNEDTTTIVSSSSSSNTGSSSSSSRVINVAQIQQTSKSFHIHRRKCTKLLENVIEQLKKRKKN